MARPLRIDIEDGWHHVMNRRADRQPVFLDDSDRIEFGARFADIHDRFGVEIHAYCLMTTHYHALLHCPNGGLSFAMQRLGSVYTLHLNDRVGRDGALFRGRFHSRIVESDAHLTAAARYMSSDASEAWMETTFRFPSRNALRSAMSRVRGRLRSDAAFASAIERTASLVLSTRLQQGSDLWCNQRAARAAS